MPDSIRPCRHAGLDPTSMTSLLCSFLEWRKQHLFGPPHLLPPPSSSPPAGDEEEGARLEFVAPAHGRTGEALSYASARTGACLQLEDHRRNVLGTAGRCACQYETNNRVVCSFETGACAVSRLRAHHPLGGSNCDVCACPSQSITQPVPILQAFGAPQSNPGSPLHPRRGVKRGGGVMWGAKKVWLRPTKKRIHGCRIKSGMTVAGSVGYDSRWFGPA